MIRLFSIFFFTRMLLTSVLANLFVFILSYISRMPVPWTPPVYAAVWVLIFAGIRKIRFRKTRIVADKLSLGCIIIALMLLVVPRLTYLIDWLPGNTTLTHSDDYARIMEVLAMTANERYPLLSPSNQNYLFSFYYSSLYPFAAIKSAVPFLTIKEVLAIGNWVYDVLILLCLYELAFLLLRDVRSVRVFLFLCTLFGGLDWLTDPGKWYGHYEWWQRRLHGNTQISSFYSGMFWTVHHFLGAVIVILAYSVLFYTRSCRNRRTKPALVLTLLAASFYTSPFAFMPVLIFLVFHGNLLRRWIRSWSSYLIVLVSAPPLLIFLGKLPRQTFVHSTFHVKFTGCYFWDRVLSLPVYLTLVPVVEMIGIPILLVLIFKKMKPVHRKYVTGGWLFFISTYWVAYSGYNNYCMRGMFIPTFVFYLIFARYRDRIENVFSRFTGRHYKTALVVILVFLSVGTFKEMMGRLMESLSRCSFILKEIDAPVPGFLKLPIYQIARNRKIKAVDFEYACQTKRGHIYDFEKFIKNLDVPMMENWELELLRKPLFRKSDVRKIPSQR